MKKYLLSLFVFFGILFFGMLVPTDSYGFSAENVAELIAQSDSSHVSVDAAVAHAADEVHHSAPAWLVIPFLTLLAMIATGPLFYEHFWHHNYPKVAVGFALLVVVYYLFVLDNVHAPVHALAEYVQL